MGAFFYDFLTSEPGVGLFIRKRSHLSRQRAAMFFSPDIQKPLTNFFMAVRYFFR